MDSWREQDHAGHMVDGVIEEERIPGIDADVPTPLWAGGNVVKAESTFQARRGERGGDFWVPWKGGIYAGLKDAKVALAMGYTDVVDQEYDLRDEGTQAPISGHHVPR